VVLAASAGFVLLYGTVIRDSLPERAAADQSLPTPGARLDYVATAYCKGSMTATGTRVNRNITGLAAADPDLLPLGSVVSITSDLEVYSGIYMVLDTGPAVQGRQIDIYMWSCFEALDFGRRPIELRILRLGWSPSNTEPFFIDSAFSEREASARARGADQPLPRPAPPEDSQAGNNEGSENDKEGDTAATTPDESLAPSDGDQ
jgi:3D (Asp-Asp-Asp) domain-containing protein